MQIVPTDSGCGAEIVGVDLNALSDAEVEAVADAQAAYGVVFFRDQELTADDQLAAARRFGPINVNRFFTAVPEQPQVAMVLKEPHHQINVAFWDNRATWHHALNDYPGERRLMHRVTVDGGPLSAYRDDG